MGGGGSKNVKKDARDPEDKTLDEVEIDELGIETFDGVFTKASEPLNSAVTTNNSLVAAVDKLTEAAAALLGAYQTKIEFAAEGKAVSFLIFKKDDDEMTVVVVEFKAKEDVKLAADWGKLTGGKQPKPGSDGAQLTAAIAGADKAATALSKQLSDGGHAIEIKNNRAVLVPKTSEAGDDKKKKKAELAAKAAAQAAVNNFNVNMFKVKSCLLKLVIEDGIKSAIPEVLAGIKKACENAKPSVKCDFAKLAEGDIDLEIDWGIEIDLLPPRVRKAYDAIMGDDGLVAEIKKAVAACAAIPGQCEAAKTEIEGLPKDMKEIGDLAKEAGLGPMEILKIPKKVLANSKSIATAPGIAKGILDNVKEICAELTSGLSGAASDSGAK
jgi:hypothetical protein